MSASSLRAVHAARRGCGRMCHGTSWVLEQLCPWWPNSPRLASAACRSRDSILRHRCLSRLSLKTQIGRIIGNWSSLQPDETPGFLALVRRRRSDLHLPRGLPSSTLQWLAGLFSVRDRDKGFS